MSWPDARSLDCGARRVQWFAVQRLPPTSRPGSRPTQVQTQDPRQGDRPAVEVKPTSTTYGREGSRWTHRLGPLGPLAASDLRFPILSIASSRFPCVACARLGGLAQCVCDGPDRQETLAKAHPPPGAIVFCIVTSANGVVAALSDGILANRCAGHHGPK